MSDNNRKALDLDELFGQARAVKVKWQGKEYELLRLQGINPKQAVRFQQLQRRAAKLQGTAEDMSDEQAVELEELIDEMLKVICRALPIREMPFMAKMRVLAFYAEETQGKKAWETALRPLTGRRSSRA